MLRRALHATILVAAAGAAACAGQAAPQTAPQSQPRTAVQQRLQDKFAEIHKLGTFPGGTAAAVLADGSIVTAAVGVSDKTANTPMKPTDRLLLGSVGKTYVAAVALQMIHEKKFSLDDTLDEFFSSEPWFGRIAHASRITVRHLMTHTSGLVRYELNPKFTADLSANPDKVWTGPDRLAYLFDATPPFEPGAGWQYSDTNYIVVGMIIEKVSGAKYYDELRRRILVPLRLKDTVAVESRTVPGLVQGYAGDRNPFGGRDEMITDGKFAVNPQFEWTGGGLAVTALDLAKWGKALYEGKAFHPSLLPAMLEGVPAQLGPESKYGLGVIIRPSALGTTWGHSGFMPGYQTELLYFPDLKLSLALQVNTSTRIGQRPPRAVALDLAAAVKGS